ncbi:MAG: hypothetical protein K0Q95_16 [Bacteroidota bacterium]|jgi:hypothetical protein|nr:hypothetical protein [Bacteroidota bacterium]
MTAKNYDQLPVSQKADILWDEGKFIDSIELNNFDVSLYALDDRFIEMYYSLEKNRIEKIRVINDLSRLRKYKAVPRNMIS